MDERTVRRLIDELGVISASIERLRAILNSSLGAAPAATSSSKSPNLSLLPSSPSSPPSSPSPAKTGAEEKTEEGRDVVAEGNDVGGGMGSVLDLSGDLKVLQLALMRLGSSTEAQLAEATGLISDELRTYLRTLERREMVVRSEGDGERTWRPVIARRGRTGGTSSLLDRLG